MRISIPREIADCDDFIHSYLPKIILIHATDRLHRDKDSAMNAYLRSIGVNRTVAYILRRALGSLECSIAGDDGVIEVSDKEMLDGYTLSQLCRLIDFGNAEVHGLNILNGAFNDVSIGMARLVENYLTEI